MFFGLFTPQSLLLQSKLHTMQKKMTKPEILKVFQTIDKYWFSVALSLMV